jgi:hypothetical protein
MSAAPSTNARGAALLIAHCAALDGDERAPVADRLHQLIGSDLTRLLVVALASSARDHRVRSRDLAA